MIKHNVCFKYCFDINRVYMLLIIFPYDQIGTVLALILLMCQKYLPFSMNLI